MPIISSNYVGRCRQCNVRHDVGTKVSWEAGTKGVICLDCVERGMSNKAPPAVAPPPTHVTFRRKSFGIPFKNRVPTTPLPPPPLLSTLILTALSALEAVIIDTASKHLSPEAESAWKKYQAIKAHCLRPGTPQEEAVALKQALLQAVKLAL